MSIFYDLIFILVSLVYLPVYLFKRKFHAGFLSRLGILPEDLKFEDPIWIHAVSVGEAITIKGLAEELRKAYPGRQLVISTVTPTGNKIAKTIAGENDVVIYLPLDFSFIVRGVLNKINPRLFILTETELWPNLISCLKQKGIPVAVVNARISDASYRGYLFVRPLIKPLIRKVDFFCAQTQTDVQRLLSLGVLQDNVGVMGNMKFDARDYGNLKRDYAPYRRKLGLRNEDRLFVSGSTHPGEEETVVGVYKNLIKRIPDLKLLIAPRHPERAGEVASLIEGSGFSALRLSLLGKESRETKGSGEVFILDTVGELSSYYAIADIVFVGGSLVKVGGHNILEPALLGKPVVFGPHMFNFRDIAELFLQKKAATMVSDSEAMEKIIMELLTDSAKMSDMTRQAYALIEVNKGATHRCLENIKRLMPG